jgi:hypothetical protein
VVDADLDVGTDLVDRRLDLLHRQVGGLAAGRAEHGEVTGQRHQIADRQLERRLRRGFSAGARATAFFVFVAARGETAAESDRRHRKYHWPLGSHVPPPTHERE